MASVIEPTAPATAPKTEPMAAVRAILKPVASLQLTVALFALSMVLVFFGTLAQRNSGIWTVVDRYFWSELVWIDLQLLVDFGTIFFSIPKDTAVHGAFPFPGGRLIGLLMFFNLLAAHTLRFRLTWKRSGIFILHAGVLLLFVGEFITREFQVEQQMVIPEGDATNYTVDTKNFELAFAVPNEGDLQRVTVVPAARLRATLSRGERISHPDLPADVEVLRYHVNCRPVPIEKMADNPATAGVGLTRGVLPAGEVPGVDLSKETDVPAAYVRFYEKGTDKVLGTYLVSLFFDEQPVQLGGVTADVSLRRTHYYKPYSLYLSDFRFDRYVGTQTPKNYSSQVRLLDPDRGTDREVLISMNEPLRYRGETFYQADFDKRTETTTVLQVVRNPGWVLPYLSCVLVALGMMIHFGIGLYGFIMRTSGARSKSVVPDQPASGFLGSLVRLLANRGTASPPLTTAFQRAILWIPVGVAVLYILMLMMNRPSYGPIDLGEVARLPVVDGGRVKPLDTVARVNLRLVTHRETYTDHEGETRPAIQWFMEMASADDADAPIFKANVFRVENDRLIELLGLERRDGLRYSFHDIRPKMRELFEAALKARERPAKERDAFEVKTLEVYQHLDLAFALRGGQVPLLLPPGEGTAWRSYAEAQQAAEDRMLDKLGAATGRRMRSFEQLRQMLAQVEDKEQRQQLAAQLDGLMREATESDRAAVAWQVVLSAYRSGKQERLDKSVADFRKFYAGYVPAADLARPRFETFLNETALYYNIEYLYLLAALLTLGGWACRAFDAGLSEAWRRAAFYVLIPTLLVHTFTLFGRMYLMDRPLVFVTNLYSSAVFIGWAAVGLCLVIERLFPLGLGNFVAAVAGGSTCIIAHNLAASGDTLEMMQAVLDTNFWLATHVTTVTLGYAATYVAGLIGLIYVVSGLLTPVLRKPFTLGVGPAAQTLEVGRAVGMVLYGVICFAALLSFVGTVLGGIWADQSWGRFWGWDPKENGAVLIVVWNALILHARWCGLVKDRGMAVLALVGVMITTWSWFGTNQLGVGLHDYGFNDKLARGCAVTWIVTLGLIAAGLVPKRHWASFRS